MAQTINAGLDMPVYQRLEEHGINISKSDSQSIPIAEYVLAYALQHAQDVKFRGAPKRQDVETLGLLNSGKPTGSSSVMDT